ncbi:MAG: hypothetical protein JWN00_1193 [Actinomycetia bacterium]|nr:hypothetical protein [Actinomycetes bacterium]
MQEEGGGDLCVLDAVVCVHFAGANLQRILIDVLRRSGLVLLVPQEVCDEIAGKESKYPGLKQRWARLEASQYIRVLPRLDAETTPRRVIEVIEHIRDIGLESAVRARKDLGEVVVVAYCVHFADQGHEVMALIDDQEGRLLAASWQVPVLTIENVLTLAIHLGHFRARSDLQKAYARLREYGDGLLPLEKSGLLEGHVQWAQSMAGG